MLVTQISHKKFWRVEADVIYPGNDKVTKVVPFYVMVDETPRRGETKDGLDARAKGIAERRAIRVINPSNNAQIRARIKVSRNTPATPL